MSILKDFVRAENSEPAQSQGTIQYWQGDSKSQSESTEFKLKELLEKKVEFEMQLERERTKVADLQKIVDYEKEIQASNIKDLEEKNANYLSQIQVLKEHAKTEEGKARDAESKFETVYSAYQTAYVDNFLLKEKITILERQQSGDQNREYLEMVSLKEQSRGLENALKEAQELNEQKDVKLKALETALKESQALSEQKELKLKALESVLKDSESLNEARLKEIQTQSDRIEMEWEGKLKEFQAEIERNQQLVNDLTSQLEIAKRKKETMSIGTSTDYEPELKDASVQTEEEETSEVEMEFESVPVSTKVRKNPDAPYLHSRWDPNSPDFGKSFGANESGRQTDDQTSKEHSKQKSKVTSTTSLTPVKVKSRNQKSSTPKLGKSSLTHSQKSKKSAKSIHNLADYFDNTTVFSKENVFQKRMSSQKESMSEKKSATRVVNLADYFDETPVKLNFSNKMSFHKKKKRSVKKSAKHVFNLADYLTPHKSSGLKRARKKKGPSLKWVPKTP